MLCIITTQIEKNKIMIDTKSKLVLSALAKECGNGGYKIVEISDIIMSLPRHYRMDSEAVKHILTHLERQDIISIKYDDEDVYCIAVMPYGFEILEETKYNKIEKDKNKIWKVILLCFLSAFVGTTLGIVVCYFLLKLF